MACYVVQTKEQQKVESEFRHGDGKQAAQAAHGTFKNGIDSQCVRLGKAGNGTGAGQKNQGRGQEDAACGEKKKMKRLSAVHGLPPSFLVYIYLQ